jgi:hypothetical protein
MDMTSIEDELRSRLLNAVPQLVEPADRLGQVAARIRRRRAAAAAIALPVVLAAGVGTMWVRSDHRGAPGQPHIRPGTVAVADCSAVEPRTSRPFEVPDAPVVPAGARTVTLCGATAPGVDTARAFPATGPSVPSGVPDRALVLTGGVERLAAALNALGRQAAVASCPPDAAAVFLVFSYVGAPPLVVRIVPGCRLVEVGGQRRTYGADDPLALFDRLYRAQASAVPSRHGPQ